MTLQIQAVKKISIPVTFSPCCSFNLILWHLEELRVPSSRSIPVDTVATP